MLGLRSRKSRWGGLVNVRGCILQPAGQSSISFPLRVSLDHAHARRPERLAHPRFDEGGNGFNT